MNALDLTIKKATVRMNDDSSLQTSEGISFSTDNETATLKFPKELPVGDGVLDIVFAGNLNDKMKGFYRSKYFTPSGEERYASVTQL